MSKNLGENEHPGEGGHTLLHQSLHTSLKPKKKAGRSKSRKENKQNDELERKSWHNIRDRLFSDRNDSSSPKKSTSKKEPSSTKQSTNFVDRPDAPGINTAHVPPSAPTTPKSSSGSNRKRSQKLDSGLKSPMTQTSSSTASKHKKKTSGKGKDRKDKSPRGGGDGMEKSSSHIRRKRVTGDGLVSMKSIRRLSLDLQQGATAMLSTLSGSSHHTSNKTAGKDRAKKSNQNDIPSKSSTEIPHVSRSVEAIDNADDSRKIKASDHGIAVVAETTSPPERSIRRKSAEC